MIAGAFPERALVLLDETRESEQTLERAVRLARHSGGELSVLRVLEPLRSRFFSAESRDKRAALLDEMQTLLERQLMESVKFARDAGVQVTAKVLRGRGYQEAIREVLRRDHDLLLLASPVATGERGELDSEALHLLRKCPCPVWIDRTGGRPVKRLLVAVDLEPAEEDPPSLSAKLMRLGLAIAVVDSAAVHVAHSWALYREESTMRLASEAADWLSREAATRHAQRLNRFLDQCVGEGMDVQVHLEHGRPEETIPQRIRRERIDLLLLGSVTRTGVPGLFFGRTAERLVHRVGCSVLAAKPEGFRSTVTLGS